MTLEGITRQFNADAFDAFDAKLFFKLDLRIVDSLNHPKDTRKFTVHAPGSWELFHLFFTMSDLENF